MSIIEESMSPVHPKKFDEAKNITVNVDNLIRDLQSPPVKEVGNTFLSGNEAEVSPSIRDSTYELKLNLDP